MMLSTASIAKQVLAQGRLVQAFDQLPAIFVAADYVRQLVSQPCSWTPEAAHRLPFSTQQHQTNTAATQQQAEQQQQQQQAVGQSTNTSSSSSEASSNSSSSEASSNSSSSEASSNNSNSEASSSDGSDAFAGFKQSFGSFASQFASSSSSNADEQGSTSRKESLQKRMQQVLSNVRREVSEAVLPRQEGYSLTRAYEGPAYEAPNTPYEGSTALAAVKQPETKFNKLLSDLYEKFGGHPIFAKLRGVGLTNNPVYRKGQELADDLRDKYETSDHPAVHKVEDVKERLFGMSETASAMALIRSRDPRFDMSRLLQGVRFDAPIVVKAFLTHDVATLKAHCGPELLERLDGTFRYFEQQGLFEDPTILFTGEPELVELKLVEDEPLVVVQFACQQLKCTRDKFGNVMDGSPNSIQRVIYFWGLQQEHAGTVLPDGRVLPPRWVIKDMMWQSMLALV